MQVSIHVKVVGLALVLAGARSNLCALADMTWVNNLLEYRRNAGRPDCSRAARTLLSRIVSDFGQLMIPR